MRRVLLFGAALASIAAAFVEPVSAQTAPPTLTGETFTISPPQVTASCNPGGTSSISFTVSGVAVGPYPGSYTESGTVLIGPQLGPPFVNTYAAGPVTSVDASFTITSPTGQVTGTKSLPAPTVDAYGICQTLPAGSFYEVCACALSLAYTATVDSAGAQYQDQGRAGLILDQVQGLVPIPFDGIIQPTNTFEESFASSLQQLIPLCDQNSQGNQGQPGNSQGCVNP